MYNAEVLSKFPVVQHFPFGSLFSWDQDPNAAPIASSVHTTNQPAGRAVPSAAGTTRSHPRESTKAPWANPPVGGVPSTAVPWAQVSTSQSQSGQGPTGTPWAVGRGSNSAAGNARTAAMPPPSTILDGLTRAPWAEGGSGGG
jgi:serine/threonine-protein phosphatase 2A activator